MVSTSGQKVESSQPSSCRPNADLFRSMIPECKDSTSYCEEEEWSDCTCWKLQQHPLSTSGLAYLWRLQPVACNRCPVTGLVTKHLSSCASSTEYLPIQTLPAGRTIMKFVADKRVKE
eukprot:673765-Pelagomonas_calceolata.AAC.5